MFHTPMSKSARNEIRGSGGRLDAGSGMYGSQGGVFSDIQREFL